MAKATYVVFDQMVESDAWLEVGRYPAHSVEGAIRQHVNQAKTDREKAGPFFALIESRFNPVSPQAELRTVTKFVPATRKVLAESPAEPIAEAEPQEALA